MIQPSAPRLLLVVNSVYFFISHRLPIAEAAIARGFKVHVAGEIERATEAAQLEARNIQLHPLSTTRGSAAFGDGIALTLRLLRLYRRIRPDIVHHITAKPVIFGSMAARLVPGIAVVNAISGLGYVFASRDRFARWVRAPMLLAYRLAMTGRRTHCIFQNESDAAAVLGRRTNRPRTHLIRGSGVDLRRFVPVPEPETAPTVLLPARMLRDKGVVEYCEAASILRYRIPGAKFLMAGRLDPGNPSGLKRPEVENLCSVHGVTWVGEHPDMSQLMAAAHLICLPSYREGMPKALIEACATGRAIVTTDVPGCSTVVTHGVNGLLIPPRDSHALADAIGYLLENRELREKMGTEGRKRAQALFDVRQVVDRTLSIYLSALERI